MMHKAPLTQADARLTAQSAHMQQCTAVRPRILTHPCAMLVLVCLRVTTGHPSVTGEERVAETGCGTGEDGIAREQWIPKRLSIDRLLIGAHHPNH